MISSKSTTHSQLDLKSANYFPPLREAVMTCAESIGDIAGTAIGGAFLLIAGLLPKLRAEEFP